jgi:hypothetical protein
MSHLIFSIVYCEETKEIFHAGNMPAAVALNLIQQVVITEAVKKAQAEKGAADSPPGGDKATGKEAGTLQ